MKIAHLTDLHYSRGNKDLALASLRTFTKVCADEGVDAIVSSGDLFDAGIQNSAKDGFPELLDAIEELLGIAPIFAVEGTLTHDLPGAYEALTRINAPYAFRMLDPGESVVYNGLLIIGIPEPGKGWLLADKNGVGKDEAKEAIESGMRSILLGCGAVRKEHPDIPCVLVYHGSIRGASMANGQTVPQGEIAIGRDDLALVGADYYALGHIHLSQQIGDLPAYYGGSAYPVNWGETDKKRFNVVELKAIGIRTVVHSHDYPHPPRKKIVRKLNEEICADDVSGYQTWIVEQTQAGRTYDFDSTQDFLNEHALPGSKFTVEIIPTETVRASEIREQKSLRDKLRVWAESSDQELDEREYEKADSLEEQAREQGISHEGAQWRIDRIRLRGAIGLWKNSGRDEIDLDLEAYDPGLIALVGENGSGKSTLIESMHPFPSMLTRSGTLQSHFRLRDSYRDLTFTDERTGDSYRALLLIDGQNKSGSVEYFLYRNGEPVTNGRKADYEEKIAELFGSIELYLRSAFVTQKATKANPDLADATPGEKKAVFRELAGLDYLQAYSLSARERAKAAEDQAALLGAKLEAMPSLEADLTEQRKRHENALHEADDADRNALQLLSATNGLIKQQDELELSVKDIERERNKLAELEKSRNEVTADLQEIERDIAQYESAIEGRDNAEHDAETHEKLSAELAQLKEERAQALEERNQALTAYNARAEAYRDSREAWQQQVNEIERRIVDDEKEKDSSLDRIDELNERLAEKITCPKCSHQFAHDEEKLNAKLTELQQKVADLDVEINNCKDEREAKVINEAPGDPPKEIEIDLPDDGRIKSLDDDLAFIDVNRAKGIIERAREAATKLELTREKQDAQQKKLGELEKEMAEVQGWIDASADLEAEYEMVKSQVAEAQARYDALQKEIAKYRAQAEEIEKTIAATESKLNDLSLDEAKQNDAIIEASEWRLLERATGQDGIQALELDALAPGISDITNRLLESAYGSRFRVAIETTRIGGSGSKTKQIEDFQIVIHDAERGTEQTLDTLSGGERVWIVKALYDAFGIIRAQNTGLQFQTVFLDEADGALDPEAKEAYCRMIQAAHDESGRRHTILITHSPAVQDQIAQRIEMSELAEAVAESVPA